MYNTVKKKMLNSPALWKMVGFLKKILFQWDTNKIKKTEKEKNIPSYNFNKSLFI